MGEIAHGLLGELNLGPAILIPKSTLLFPSAETSLTVCSPNLQLLSLSYHCHTNPRGQFDHSLSFKCQLALCRTVAGLVEVGGSSASADDFSREK